MKKTSGGDGVNCVNTADAIGRRATTGLAFFGRNICDSGASRPKKLPTCRFCFLVFFDVYVPDECYAVRVEPEFCEGSSLEKLEKLTVGFSRKVETP